MPDMTATVKLATARELAQTGSVRQASLLGQHGGYAIVLRVGMSDRVLATKSGAPRLFAQLDRAARLLRDELGIARFAVDAANYAPGNVVRRPDRAAALLQQTEDAAYAAFLRERTEVAAAQADAHPDTILSNADAEARVKTRAAALQARLDRAIVTHQ
jgi:hypothetical protein